MFPTIPYSNFGLTGTSNIPGPQPTLGGTSSKIQKLNHTTLNQQTTCVGRNQPDVCCDNIVAALKVHTEGTNKFPLSGLGTSNSTQYLDHKLCTNEDNISYSITPMLSDLVLILTTTQQTKHQFQVMMQQTVQYMRNILIMRLLYMLGHVPILGGSRYNKIQFGNRFENST